MGTQTGVICSDGQYEVRHLIGAWVGCAAGFSSCTGCNQGGSPIRRRLPPHYDMIWLMMFSGALLMWDKSQTALVHSRL